MANIKVSQLAALTPPAAADVLPIVDISANATKKTTVGEIVGIVNGDVNVANDGTATISELPVSKLQDGDARQLLQTDAAGTGVEWTSNVDVPGTLDVTGAATFDEHVNLASAKEYRIAGIKVLDATSLGSAVVSSSLTSVGTIGTGTWQGSTIATVYGGTGQTTYAEGELLIGTTAGSLAKATLTPGSGIDIANGDGSVTVDVDLKANGGLVIESTELAVDLGASSITGTLSAADGGTGQTTYTDGQLLIGNSTGNTLAKATLTAGTGITVTNGSGTITLAIDSDTAIADITTTATTGTLPTADGSVTIADAAAPTVSELLEYCVELEAKLETALAALRTVGVIAT